MMNNLLALPVSMLCLASCSLGSEASDPATLSPEAVLSSLSNANSKSLNEMMVSEFRASRFGDTTVYTIEEGYGPEACGSSGCNWSVYVKIGDGASKRVFEGLAYNANVFRIEEDRFRIVLTSSGLSCKNKTNIEHCDRAFEWDGHRLIEASS